MTVDCYNNMLKEVYSVFEHHLPRLLFKFETYFIYVTFLPTFYRTFFNICNARFDRKFLTKTSALIFINPVNWRRIKSNFQRKSAKEDRSSVITIFSWGKKPTVQWSTKWLNRSFQMTPFSFPILTMLIVNVNVQVAWFTRNLTHSCSLSLRLSFSEIKRKEWQTLKFNSFPSCSNLDKIFILYRALAFTYLQPPLFRCQATFSDVIDVTVVYRCIQLSVFSRK